MILLPPSTTPPGPLHRHPHHHIHPPSSLPLHPHPPSHPPFELARPEVLGNAATTTTTSRAMPESSGDLEVLSPPRIHLASRRRFDLKLDLASALSGRQEKKRPRLDVLTAPALLSTRLSAQDGSSAVCGGGSPGCVPGQVAVHGKDSASSSSSSSGSSPMFDQPDKSVLSVASCFGTQSQSPCLSHHHNHHHHHQHHHQHAACLGQHTSSFGQQHSSACFVGQHSCLVGQQSSGCVEQQQHHQHGSSCGFRSSPRTGGGLGSPQERTLLLGGGGGGGGSAGGRGSPMSTTPTSSSSTPSPSSLPFSGQQGVGQGGHLPPSFRAISSGELAAKLRKCRPVLVIDCRPFLCYNAHHVQGALNISCTDRFNRKRLQQGKVSVLDLLASTHGKDTFRRRPIREVVLYDERGGAWGAGGGGASGAGVGGCGGGGVVVGGGGPGCHQDGPPSPPHALESDSALHIVLTTLLREGRQPAVLQGGMKQFEADHPELVWSSKRLEVPGRLLCSPTNDTVEPEIETATASRVLPFLYLGNERDAAELERLRRHNITYVLNVTAHVPHYWHAHGIRYKRIPASDSAQQNLKQYFEEAIDYIDEARQKGASVLIHCHAGVSRSATITIAYILKHSKMPMSDAYKYVKGKRGIISPNFNFLGQLLEFEQDLNKDVSQRVLSPRLTLELEPAAAV